MHDPSRDPSESLHPGISGGPSSTSATSHLWTGHHEVTHAGGGHTTDTHSRDQGGATSSVASSADLFSGGVGGDLHGTEMSVAQTIASSYYDSSSAAAARMVFGYRASNGQHRCQWLSVSSL